MFTVDQGVVREMWVPLDGASASTVLTVGQLVKCDSTSFNGFGPLAVASGDGDTSGKQVVAGVVIGTNDATPTYNGTYGQYISTTAPLTQALQVARKCLGNGGTMNPINDPQPLVKIAKINANTVLSANIFNAAQGTAPTLLTVTTGSTTGAGMTTNATQFTPVANFNTFYCRKGANAGIYRVSETTSTTVHTFHTYWPYDIAVGDQFVAVPLRLGQSLVQINSTSGYRGMWLEASASPATNYFIIDVLDMDLSVAGKETALFTFAPCHFDLVRA